MQTLTPAELADYATRAARPSASMEGFNPADAAVNGNGKRKRSSRQLHALSSLLPRHLLRGAASPGTTQHGAGSHMQQEEEAEQEEQQQHYQAHRRGLRFVVGKDDRTQQTDNNYAGVTAGRVVFQDPVTRASRTCSGILVAPNAVLLAGHCIWNPTGRYFYNRWTFTPGLRSGSVAPYGTVAVKYAVGRAGEAARYGTAVPYQCAREGDHGGRWHLLGSNVL